MLWLTYLGITMAGYDDFTKLPIFRDIKKTLDKGKEPVTFRYNGTIHTKQKDIKVIKIISIDTIRNYINNIADEIHIIIYLDTKQYLRDIYPYAANLEFTFEILELSITEYSDEKVLNRYRERFKAVVKDKENVNAIDTKADKHSDLELGLIGPIEVRLQLINRIIEPLRIKQTNGVFTKVTPKDFLNGLLYSESNQITVEGKPILQGIDIADPVSNTEVQHNIVIPSGTSLIDIPDLAQNQFCGVYSGALGSYVQFYDNKYIWFIYPLYDYTRFDSTKGKKVIFYVGDKATIRGSEKTYRIEGNTIYIVITGNTQYYNDLESGYMDSGAGIKAPHAKAFMKKPVILTKDGVVGKRNRLNHEAVVKDRSDGLNFTPRVKDGVTANPFKVYSEIASKSVAQITLEWNHAKYDLIYPGMPCRYTFTNNGKLTTVTGTILQTHTLISLKGNASTSNLYTINTMINIAVDKTTTILADTETKK